MGFRRRGREAPTEDVLFTELEGLRQSVAQQDAAMDQMQQGALVGAAIPADPFVVSRRTKNRGEVVTLGFFIDKSCTSVTCFLIALPDNKDLTGGMTDANDIKAARAKVLESEFDDISDEERAAGFIAREFGDPLAFSTRYGVTRTVARNDATGLVATIKNPSENPYGLLPFPIVNRSSDGITLTTDACFTTGDSDGQGGTDECGMASEVGLVQPRPHPTAYVKSQKITQRGVKVKLQIVVPRTAKTVRVRLIKTDDIIPGPMPDFTASVSYRWDVTPGDLTPTNFAGAEADARIFTGDFGEKLDFGAEYQTIRIVVEGEGVGGSGLDIIKTPTSGAAMIANGTFTAGASTTGTNANLRLGSPWVDVTADPMNNNLPKGFKIKRAGVKAIMNFVIPPETLTLKCRIRSASDVNALTLSDEWDDITDTERSSGTATRQFGPLLDFLSVYNFVRLIAEGDNIGGDAVDIAKSGPPTVTGMFPTCDSEGNFPTATGGLSFAAPFPFGRRTTKKGGVFVKFKINIPKTTQKITVKVGAIADAADKSKVLEYQTEDIDDSERAAGFIIREFGIKLENNPTVGNNYGAIRLIAEGENVNPALVGGNNPDVYRNPRTQPPTPFTYQFDGGFDGRFDTGADFQFPGVTSIPAIPIAADIITNSLDPDSDTTNPQALTVIRIFATNFRAGGGNGGTATDVSGGVSFFDVGVDSVSAVLNPANQSADGNRIVVPADLTAENQNKTFVDVDVSAQVKFGKQYTYKRAIALGSAGKSVAVAPTAITFRAGGDSDLNALLNFNVTAQLIDPRNSLVLVNYTEPAATVLIKNMSLEKDILNKTNGYKETEQRRLLDDPTKFTAGGHTEPFSVQHPQSSQIRYRATIRAIKGGVTASRTALFPIDGSYILTDAEPGVTDPGRPQFSGQRTDGGFNSSPFKLPDLRLRFRAGGIKLRINKPDVNNLSFDRVFFFFTFAGTIIPSGIGVFTSFKYYYNPNSDAFIKFDTTGGAVFIRPGDSLAATFGIDIGQAVGDFFPIQRPNFQDAGELPQAIYADLVASANSGATPGMVAETYVVNRATSEAAGSIPGIGGVNALFIASQLNPFTAGSQFQGLVTTGTVS